MKQHPFFILRCIIFKKKNRYYICTIAITLNREQKLQTDPRNTTKSLADSNGQDNYPGLIQAGRTINSELIQVGGLEKH